MTIQTDLGVSPYFDDFSPDKDYYRVLFRPGVSVQARELNQLQSILQNQISSFGDNVFKQGTIIDGCDITFHDDLKYVKLRDTSTDSQLIDVTQFVGYRVKNQNNITPLEATIIASERGFESTDPDLNTLYIRYINSGFSTGGPAEGITQFEPLELLTVYDPSYVVERVSITEEGKSQGFSPNDKVVFVSAIEVQNTSGGIEFGEPYAVGQIITSGSANAEIVSISTELIPGSLVLSITPLPTDLKSGNPAKWTFPVDTNIQTDVGGPLAIAQVKSIIGAGATARLSTSSLGRIESIQITNKGSGYTIAPTVNIASPSNSPTNIGLFVGTAETFVSNVVVGPSISQSVGSSYGVTVGEGIIYSKGCFSRVAEQLLIVEKYNNQPNGITVGFETLEEVINSNQDPTLLDNALGSPNATAPGANRLKLTPNLIRLTDEEADLRNDFLYVAKFSDGKPFKQNRQTVYNVIGNEISRRISEESGDYILDQFLLQTKSSTPLSEDASNFSTIIDPGKAYINGNRVETESNFVTKVDKGIDVFTSENANISLNFGNFIRVNQLAGVFDFKAGDIVELYKTASSYYETFGVGSPINRASLTLTNADLAGYARIRSIVFDSGIPGTKDSVYRLYLFDINLSPGVTFEQCSSVFYDGTLKGICDIKEARLEDVNTSSLIFYAGAPAVKNVASVSYIYRTSSVHQFNNSGDLTIALPALGDETFPYTGSLSSIQERDIIVIPSVNMEAATNLTGTIHVHSGSNTATIAGSTSFAAELKAGDFIKVGNNINYLQVNSVAANGTVSFAEASTFNSNTTFKYAFPANIPVSFEYRDTRTITADPTQKQLAISFGQTLTAGQEATIFYNVRQGGLTPVAKTVNRNRFVRVIPGTNENTNVGPWCLGVADAFRLNAVYLGPNNNFVPGAVDTVDVTQYFYIDNNQNENYVNQSFLYLKPNSPITIPNNTSASLLISFDYFSVTEEGIKVPGGTGTYNTNDSTPIESASSSIHTLEIPELFGDRGTYYDLRDQFDFRPSVISTATPSANAAIAPTNPLELTFNGMFTTNNKKFPAPDSELSATISYYQNRTDLVVVDSGSNFRIIKGKPGSTEVPAIPENALVIQAMKIPAYPSVPFLLSEDVLKYVDTKIASGPFTTRRLNNYRISTAFSRSDLMSFQPRRYTMRDIGNIERRVEQLEYYTSLNLVETIAQKRFIPGFDGIDRFKFGFFVDGFEDYTFADLSNPQYSASIVDGYLSPTLSEFNLKVRPAGDDISTLTYNEVTLVNQTRATDGPAITGPTGPTTQAIVCVDQSERTRNRADSGNVFEDFFYTMSSESGPVEFYINSRDNKIGAEIFQSRSPEGPWTTTITSASAQAITSVDIVSKGLKNLNGGRKIEHPGTLDRKSSPSGKPWGTWLEDQFKLLWTHNPDSGLYYRIRIYKGGRSGGLFPDGKGGTFGFKLCYPSDSSINVNSAIVTTNFPLTYQGIVLGGTNFDYQNQFLIPFHIH